MAVTVVVTTSHAQTDTVDARPTGPGFSAGLGVSLVHASDVVDYINSVSNPSDKVDDFTPAVEFFGSAEFLLGESWGGKLAYSYLLKSYNVQQPQGGNYMYSYTIHMPTVLAQYVLTGRGYLLKFGGGGGYHVATFSETYSSLGSREYRSTGVGIQLEAEGNTSLGDNLYAYLGADFRAAVMSKFEDPDGKALVIGAGGASKPVNMSFFSLGLKLGFIYYL